jgi:hypothetical protein
MAILGHRRIEEFSNHLSEHIFETELFHKLIIASNLIRLVKSNLMLILSLHSWDSKHENRFGQRYQQ